MGEFKVNDANVVLALGIGFVVALASTESILGLVFVTVLVAGFSVVTVAPMLTVLLASASSVGAAVLQAVVLRPLAWALERESIDRWIKLLAVALLVLGFHFDLLAT